MSSEAPTFVVTAELDRRNLDWLDGLRRQHFPPERNFLSAHLTLFHKLDDAGVAIVRHIVARNNHGTMTLRFTAARMLGRGVAIDVAAPALSALRSACAVALDHALTPQDRQPFRPHVTIQNKVDPETARDLHASLCATFVERTGETRAWLVWRYLGGPWQLSERLPLANDETTELRRMPEP